MSSFHRDLQEMAVIESLPLRQIPQRKRLNVPLRSATPIKKSHLGEHLENKIGNPAAVYSEAARSA